MIRVTIDGKEFPESKIRDWEKKRVQVSRRRLKRCLKQEVPASGAEELAAWKAAVPEEVLLQAFRHELAFTAFGTGLVVRLSGKRRKFSVTEIDLDFCDARSLHRLYDDMMLHKRRRINLPAFGPIPTTICCVVSGAMYRRCLRLPEDFPWCHSSTFVMAIMKGSAQRRKPTIRYRPPECLT